MVDSLKIKYYRLMVGWIGFLVVATGLSVWPPGPTVVIDQPHFYLEPLAANNLDQIDLIDSIRPRPTSGVAGISIWR